MERPLKHGEFYCHKCGKFIPLKDHEEHQKEHSRQQ